MIDGGKLGEGGLVLGQSGGERRAVRRRTVRPRRRTDGHAHLRIQK
jgi:hypothetical protein